MLKRLKKRKLMLKDMITQLESAQDSGLERLTSALVDLMADIGATTTRCALVDDKGQEVAPEVFENADFTGVAGVLRVYLDHRRASDRPKRAALAVAAPIVGDEVQMINIGWRFSQAELKRRSGLQTLQVVQRLRCDRVGTAAARTRGPRAASAAVRARRARRWRRSAQGPDSASSALVPADRRLGRDDGRRRPRVDAGAATREEQDVIALLRDRFDGHCSAERVLSGPGLVNLYVALAELAGRGQPTVTPEDVTNLAKQGEPLARKTLGMFFAMLGTVAGDLAVTTGARGGVYIAGGIVPRVVEQFASRSFARASKRRAATASIWPRFRRT